MTYQTLSLTAISSTQYADYQSIPLRSYPRRKSSCMAAKTTLRKSQIRQRYEAGRITLLAVSTNIHGRYYIFQLEVETGKARNTVKQLAKKGDIKSARILAKEVVRSERQKDRLSVSKARLGSIGTQLQQQLGMVPFSFSSCSR